MRTRGLGIRRMNMLRWLPIVVGLWLATLAPAAHRVKHRCVKGTRRHAAACTIDTTVLTITRAASLPGRFSVALPSNPVAR